MKHRITLNFRNTKDDSIDPTRGGWGEIIKPQIFKVSKDKTIDLKYEGLMEAECSIDLKYEGLREAEGSRTDPT